MAASWTGEPPNHRIMGSLYDDYMNDIELYLDALRQPYNIPLNECAHNYFTQRLQLYWLKLKNFLFASNEVIEKDVGRYFPSFFMASDATSNLEKLRHMYHDNEPRFREMLTQLNSQFVLSCQPGNKPFINILKIFQLFEYIARLFCLNTVAKIDAPQIEFKRTEIPLPNDHGLFGLNTFLYAYFEGYYLIGIPSSSSVFDLQLSCPHAFMLHDRGHEQRMRKEIPWITMSDATGGESFLKWREIYYRILNSNDYLPLRYQELAILHLWSFLHEIIPDIAPALKLTSPSSDFLKAFLDRKTIPLIIDFNLHYKRLTSILWKSPILPHLLSDLREWGKTFLLPLFTSEYFFKKLELDFLQQPPLETLHAQILAVIENKKEGDNLAANAIAWHIVAHSVARYIIVEFLQGTLNITPRYTLVSSASFPI